MPQDVNRGLSGGSLSSDNNYSNSTGSSTNVDLQRDAARVKDEAMRQGAAAMRQIKEGAQSLTEGAKEQVSNLADQAKEQASRYAEEQKQVVTQHLDDFAQAIREASDTLSQRDQTMASHVVRQAAGGLESLSRSVAGANLQDMIGAVRNFGRSNPLAFLGGAVLVGLAVGRFARASSQPQYGDQYGNQYGRRMGGGQDEWSRSSGSSATDAWRNWDEERTAGDAGTAGSYGGASTSSGASGENRPFASGSQAMGDYPAPNQGYGGGGMGSDPVQSSGPSSDTDESVTVATPSGSSFSSGSISTGDDR